MLSEIPLVVLRLYAMLVLLVVILVPTGVIMLRRRGPRRLQQLVDKAFADASPDDRRVHMRFHTYHGLLVFVTQTPHEYALPLRQAKTLLWQLHRFNLTWGLFAYGAAIIPLLSWMEYRRQLRGVERQAKGAFPVQ